MPGRGLGVLGLVCAAALGARAARACDLSPDLQAAVDARDFASAESLALAAVERLPDEPSPRIELAEVYTRWGQKLGAESQPAVPIERARSAQALQLLDLVAARWPELRAPRVCALELRMLRGENDAFLSLLQSLLQTFPEPDPALLGSLEPALQTALDHNWDELAAHACTLLVGRQDLSAPGLAQCGVAALHSEEFELARDRLLRARARDASDARAARELAQVEMLLGDLPAAQDALWALAKLEPSNLDHALALAVVRTVRAPDAAAPAWRELSDGAAQRASDASAARMRGFADQTLAAFGEAGSLTPGLLRGLARDLVPTSPAVALVLLREGAARAPDDPAWSYLRALALARLGYPRHALQLLERAAALPAPADDADVPSGAIDFEAGRMALALGRAMDAVQHLSRARRAAPALPNLEYLLAQAYAGAGDAGSATKEYSACLERPNNAPDYQRWCRQNRAALAGLLGAPPPASEPFASALAKARANASSPAGTQYQSASSAASGPQLTAAIRSCVSSLGEGGASPRTVLVRIAANGSVAEILQARPDAEPLCFASYLRGLSLPAPPSPDWWLVYDIRVAP